MVKPYLVAAKPWLVAANALSAAGGFFLGTGGAGGHPDRGLFAACLLGVSLVVASGCVFNNAIDRDIDAVMSRTKNRPLATGAISLRNGLLFGIVLGLCGALILWILASGLALAITLCGLAVYVGVYTLWLKRSSPYSAVAGSLAGAAPPLAAYCAASGVLDLGGVLLLAVFSLWQIPHSYAIALYRAKDYEAAGIPVYPLRFGVEAAEKRIVGHIAAFALAAMSLTVFGYAGRVYLAAAAVSSAAWLYAACRGRGGVDPARWGKRLHILSVVVIAVLSLAMCLDSASLAP